MKNAELFIELTELKRKSVGKKKYNGKRQEEIIYEIKELNKRGL